MGCDIFPKIDTLFERKEDFTVDTTKIRRPEFLIPSTWVVTEKIDGTNCRVSLEYTDHDENCPFYIDNPCNCNRKWVIRFYGRKENSQMPTLLLEYLQNTFTLERMQKIWTCKRGECEKCFGHGYYHDGQGKHWCENFEAYPITLYGEGYGAKIQKGGGNYRKDGDVSFRLFDVLIGGFWLNRENIEDVANQLGIKAVPSLGKDITTNFAVAMVMDSGFNSIVAMEEGIPGTKAEGIVVSTIVPLFNGAGKRLSWKLKTSDFIAGKR